MVKKKMYGSLDVIYHLVEDEILKSYMTTLFGTARKLVIIYSSNEITPGNGSEACPASQVYRLDRTKHS